MPLLEIQNLRKIYRTPEGEILTVLDVPEFTLEENQQLALRGSSGTGKTTFLNCIAGILRPDNGCVRLNGIDMAAASEGRRDQLRAQTIGYIFQTFNLLQGYTCLENVLLGMSFGRGADRAFARELLKRVGLGDRLEYRQGQLSVGQQQRVAVARALANQPKLVLADEPTGNLDSQNAKESMQLIREVCEENEATLLLVSHDQSVLDQFEVCKDLAEINQARPHQAIFPLELNSNPDSGLEPSQEAQPLQVSQQGLPETEQAQEAKIESEGEFPLELNSNPDSELEPSQVAQPLQVTQQGLPETEQAQEAKIESEGEFIGWGCIWQGIGIALPIVFLQFGLITPGIVAGFLGVALFIVGGRMGRSSVCSLCKGKVHKGAIVCEHCNTRFND